MLDIASKIFLKNGFVMSFALIGITMYLSYWISAKVTKGRVHGSAIAVILGLLLAYIGGAKAGGKHGIADLEMFSGIGLMGGAMLRDYSITATAFGVDFDEIKKAGLPGVVSLFLGVIISFLIGAIVAFAFGYTDAVSVTTIAAGAVTFIVGPITGAAVGASSEVIVLSIGAGVVKSILVMVVTPFIARFIGLNNPTSAMVYGGLMGTTSGVAAGLAATDPKLVPYGAMTATFYTGLGALLAPSVLYLITKAILG